MDEKILYGGNVAMRRLVRNPFGKSAIRFMLAAALIMILSSAAFSADLEPGETSGKELEPHIAGIQVTQLGGNAILLRVRGHEIPHPRAVTAPGENKLILQWDEARFPQNTDKRDWWDDYSWDILRMPLAPEKDTWWKQYDTPLLGRINAEPVNEHGMRMTFTSAKPLILERVEGLAGSDSLAIMLKAYEPVKAKPEPPKRPIYSKSDPMGITAPVTLQLRDADIKSVFRMLAEQQNINLLLDPSVPDMTITFSFKSVPYNEAFSYMLRMTDLSYSMVGNMLVVGRVDSLGRTLGKEIVRGYNLSYAIDDSGKLRGDLTAALTGLISLSKPPTLDQRNRTLYVTATEEQHVEVAQLLEKLDHPGRQVMIQARIIEVNDDGKQELEALVSAVYDQWLFNFSRSGLGVGYNYSSGIFEDSGVKVPIAGRPYGDDSTWKDVPVDAGFKFLSAGLSAIESKGKGKILAHPSVITLDGSEANVSLTRELKYASGVDSNGNTTFSDVEIGPELKFTPFIGRNGVITIKILIETGELISMHSAGGGAQVPETTSRKVETQVRVRNGEPFAVGGLYQEHKSKTRNRIPVLGYIPLLGDLFTFRDDEHRKSEVAMVVIPYILDIPDDTIDTYDLIKSSLNQ